MIALITAIVGLIATLVAYFINPNTQKNKIRVQLLDLYKQLDDLYRRRDEALQNNNSDELTIVTALIIKLCQTKANIMEQF